MDCRKLTLFLLYIYLRSCESRPCRETQCTYLYISPYVVVKKASLCNRNNMFFMESFHQNQENWLYLLIAWVLFVRLSISKVQGILELFFVTYQQEKIVKSSQLLQNSSRVVRLGYYSHRWVKCLDASNYEEFFFLNDTSSSKDYDRRWYS